MSLTFVLIFFSVLSLSLMVICYLHTCDVRLRTRYTLYVIRYLMTTVLDSVQVS